MSSALEVAAVGMRAQQGALDAIANNISNINTPAFKRSELRFSELVDRRPVDGVAAQKNGLQTDTLARPLIEKQGQIEATGNTRDIAIAGRGFIELAGPGGRSLLWRGGSIRILEDGALATSSGYLLKAAITVPTNATEIRIERNGKVTALLPQPEGETEIGQINLVIAADTGRIERLEGGVFAVTDFGELIEAAPGDEGFGSLVQASLESSNVDLNAEMINLLISQRAYAANAQVVRAADELYGIANGLRR
jgi:flagellar basal-body rod protein FlgG